MFRSCKDVFRSCKHSTFNTQGSVCTPIEPVQSIYGCDYCSEEFNSETETDIHKRYTHKSELNNLLGDQSKSMCKTCFSIMESEEELLKHIKSSHLLSSENCTQVEKEIFVCNHCQQIFFNKDWLITHIALCHTRMVFIPCLKCKRNIRKSALWSHLLNHDMLSISCCPICHAKFKQRNEMLVHAKSHQNKYICSTCGYDTHRELHFNQHIEKHEKLVVTSENSTTDNLYSKYFIPRNEMPMKYLVNAFGYRGYFLQDNYKICIMCRQICLNVIQMNHHIMYDHKPRIEQQKSYSCTCGEKFSNKILLKHHVFKLKGNHCATDPAKDEDSTEILYYICQNIEPVEENTKNIDKVSNMENEEIYYLNDMAHGSQTSSEST